jgi:phosphoglucosamine mutase
MDITSMGRLFGTDGVRGLANQDVTVELALDLAVAAAHVLGQSGAFTGPRPKAVVGRDPRASGEFLAAAVSAGLASAGVDVIDVGVVPTPAVAYLTHTMDVDLGVMISASHNPMQDNGIKFFDHSGFKLDDAVEDQIEARLREPWQRPTGADVGRISYDGHAVEAYLDHLVGSVPHSLAGLRVVVDCANGAASELGPEALRRAGAEVIVIGAEPDGVNINDGYGATQPRRMAAATVGHWTQAGISFDGDADRCIASDENGDIVNGDQIMGIVAAAEHERGTLRGGTLVATVMSNLGLTLAMDALGVTTLRTAVGDRYVLEEMRRGGYSVGGEQSGHVVLLDHATTGDGILTALHLLARVAETKKPLSELAATVPQLPQALVNVPGVDKSRASSDETLLAAISASERELGTGGRVLLRASGTEALVRVMVEAPTQEEADGHAQRLAEVVRSQLALA